MKFNASFRTVFQGLILFTMLSGCGKQRFENSGTGQIATNLNEFLSLPQAERLSIIDQIGYDCGYTSLPTPVEGTSIIGATVFSSSGSGSVGGQYWTLPRRCLPVCRIKPITIDEGGVVFGSASAAPVETNIHISIESLDGAVGQEELSHYFIGYCRPRGGCALVSGPPGGVSGSSGSSPVSIANGLSCYNPTPIEPIAPVAPIAPIQPVPVPVPVPAVPVK